MPIYRNTNKSSSQYERVTQAYSHAHHQRMLECSGTTQHRNQVVIVFICVYCATPSLTHTHVNTETKLGSFGFLRCFFTFLLSLLLHAMFPYTRRYVMCSRFMCVVIVSGWSLFMFVSFLVFKQAFVNMEVDSNSACMA